MGHKNSFSPFMLPRVSYHFQIVLDSEKENIVEKDPTFLFMSGRRCCKSVRQKRFKFRIPLAYQPSLRSTL